MRTPLFLSVPLLSALLLLPMPAALAQQRDDGVASQAATAEDAASDTDASATEAASDAPRSGFGQVMSVLTGLLHDAAQREATGQDEGFALDNPAIEISVTPVEGHTSLLREPIERRHAAREQQLAGGTTPQ